VHTHAGFETFCVLVGEFVIRSPYAASRQDRPKPNAGADSTGGSGGRHSLKRPFAALASEGLTNSGGLRAHPSQGQGRAQVVAEFEPELPFEIVPGSLWGAEASFAAEACGARIQLWSSGSTETVRRDIAYFRRLN
jgi:hypothetical protein